jgi:phosphohistidine phosphatase SixA
MVFIITTFFNRTKSIKFVKKQNNKIDSLAIVGHNPLLSELVKRFTKILLVLPTLGIIQIEFD